MIYFTSDTHFFHNNIIRFCNRPYSSVEEMNEDLITRWNNVVQPEDEVYHLGDVGLGSPKKLTSILQRLNGKIYLIKGNHEKAALRSSNADRFEWVKDYYTMWQEVEGKKQFIVLFHYPIVSWHRAHYNSWMLFGHTHNNYQPEYGKTMDVGVDNPLCNYAPISLDDIARYMKLREFKAVDHHKSDGL